MKVVITILTVLFFFVFINLCTLPAAASVPLEINFQGYLTGPEGKPFNGAVDMTFRIYQGANGGVVQWSESHINVVVSNGVYNLILGSSVAFPSGFFDGDVYLGVSMGSDSEMLPRTRISSAVFAVRAGVAETIVGPIDGVKINAGTATLDRFSFSTYQGPQGDQGDAGPQGPVGDKGAAGPVGPTVTTSSNCVDATYSSDGYCSCPVGTLLVVVDSPCTVTSAAGSCSASSNGDREGSCCICKTTN